MLKHKIKVAMDDNQFKTFLRDEKAAQDTDKIITLLDKADHYKFFHTRLGFWLLNKYVNFIFVRMAKTWMA